MNGEIMTVGALPAISIGVAFIVLYNGNSAISGNANAVDQLVYVGDTDERGTRFLGDPTIEFPEEGSMVRWYAGYEIVSSNNVVSSVNLKPVQTEAEKLEKENRSKRAEEQLRSAYQSMAQKEKISCNAWLARERLRLQAERVRIAAYEERKSREKRAEIYANGYRRSCGCTTCYCRHYHR